MMVDAVSLSSGATDLPGDKIAQVKWPSLQGKTEWNLHGGRYHEHGAKVTIAQAKQCHKDNRICISGEQHRQSPFTIVTEQEERNEDYSK